MTACLEREEYSCSATAIHKYMNTEMVLHSIVRPKKPGTKPGKPHKIFGNELDQDFHADKPNQKRCTDFTYLFLKNGDVRYNCAIIDLHDRSVAASITDRHITSGPGCAHPAEGIEFPTSGKGLSDPAQRPGEPVHIEGFHRVL